MTKVIVFLICISVMVAVISGIAAIEIYTLEKAAAKGFFSDILDDMQDIGYLDTQLEHYYRDKMLQMGWSNGEGDFFSGTWPRAEGSRARKERDEFVTLVLRIRPSRVSQWLHLLDEGEVDFRFFARRPSEYFDLGW